jgi:hypothetical protein
MTQPYDPYSSGQQAPAPGWAPPGGVPDPRQWQGYGPPAPPPPPKTPFWRSKKGAGLLLVGGLMAACGLANGGDGQTTQNRPGVPSGVSSGYNAQPAIVSGGGVAQAPAQPLREADDAPAAASSGPKTSFGDGTWVVGEDIVGGTYKSSGAQEGIFELCSVTTLAGDTSDSKVIDWLTANADEPMRLKVSGKVKAVKATGCETFTKVG